MNSNDKKIGSMLLQPQLLAYGMLLFGSLEVITLWHMITHWQDSVYRQISLFVILGFLICIFAGLPTWSERIILTNSGIVRYRMFKKKTYIPYSQYPYISKGYYMHRSVMIPKLGSKVPFIVISQRKLNDSALTHINHVPSSESVIKIRYSKKAYAMLMECLPEKQKYRLGRAFEEEA